MREIRDDNFIPMIGNSYYMQWSDTIVYKGRLMEQLDNGCFIADMGIYGAGIVRPGDIFEELYNIPAEYFPPC